MSAVRLGLIGVGGYGRIHVEGFLALQEQGFVQITALADPSVGLLKTLAQIPELAQARCFADYRDLLACENLDAVVISAPIPLHEEMTLAALERDVCILLEKPPVPLLSQLDRLIEADEQARVMVGFQHIYSRLIQDLKDELIAGRIGRIQSIAAHGLWSRTTGYYERSFWAGQLAWRGRPVLDGPCTNGMAHFVNILLYLAASGKTDFAAPARVAGELYRARPGLPTYDTGCLSGELENGARFFVGFSHATDLIVPVEVRLTGTRGTLLLADDCETLHAEGAPVRRGDSGRNDLRKAFLAFAAGDASKNKTPLHAMRPYLLATNLMLQSAGTIHTIPERHIRCINPGTPDAAYSVDGIATSLSQAARHVVPLAQTAAPWAEPVLPLGALDFSEPELLKSFGLLLDADAVAASRVPESVAGR